MSKILPTKKEFQTIANDIKIESNITRCQAYEKLAKQYGYKTYHDIKPLLKEDTRVIPVISIEEANFGTSKDYQTDNDLSSLYFKENTMAKKIAKIDIFENGNKLDITRIRNATLEEVEAKRKKSSNISATDFIVNEIIGKISNNDELAISILKDREKVQHEIENALKKNKAYKEAKSPKTPESLRKYQQHNDKTNMKQINDDIKEFGGTLSTGQVLFHGGLTNAKVGDTIDDKQTLSTSLCPHVAISNALHKGKAFDENELNLNLVIIEDDDINAFVYNGKTKFAHEKEVLLESNLSLLVDNKIKVNEMEVTNGKGDFKKVPVYLTKVKVKKPSLN